MIRTLLIKKLLSYGNAALAALLALFVVLQLVGSAEGGDTEEKAQAVPPPPQIQVADVADRGHYQPIVTSGLLGREKPKPKPEPKPAPPPPPPKKEETGPTTLPLKLIGTVASSDDDPLGSAIIESKSGASRKQTYFVGDEVMDRVFVKTIGRRMVVLDNQRANRFEELYLEDAAQEFRAVSNVNPRRRAGASANRRDLAERIRAARPAVSGANRIFTFSRDDIVAEIERDYDKLASNIDVELVKDAKGNVTGVRPSNLGSTPLASKFGFEEGDIVTAVNGQKVDSLDRMYDIIEKNRNASTFRVQLLRGGRPQVFTYHLR